MCIRDREKKLSNPGFLAKAAPEIVEKDRAKHAAVSYTHLIKENQCLSKLADRLQGDVPEAMCEEAETSLLQDFFQQLQRQGVSFDAYLKQQGITPDRFKDCLLYTSRCV